MFCRLLKLSCLFGLLLCLPETSYADKSDCKACAKEAKQDCKAQCKDQRGKGRKECRSMCVSSFCSLRCEDKESSLGDLLGDSFKLPGTDNSKQGQLGNQSCDLCTDNYRTICNAQCRAVPQGERNECRQDCINDSCGSSCRENLSRKEKRAQKREAKKKCKSCKRDANRSCNKECGKKQGVGGFFDDPEESEKKREEQGRCHDSCMKRTCYNQCQAIE